MSRTRKSNLNLPPRMYLKHGAYYYVTRQNKWIKLSSDLAEAKRQWAELEQPEVIEGTMESLFNRYVREVLPKKAPRTQADNKIEIERLRKVFGPMLPQDVRPMHVAKYLDIRGQKAPVRANREKALLSHVFSYAMRWGLVNSNPCKGVARNPEKGRDRYITDDEFMAVKSVASEVIQDLMDMAYITAQRISDLLKIELSDLDENGIYFEQGKTGARLLIEWTPELREVVQSIKARGRVRSCKYLFSTRTGTAYSYDGISAIFKRYMGKAMEQGLLQEKFTFHDIRAKSLTDAKDQGLNAQKLAGHKNSSMTDAYIKQRTIEKVTPISIKKVSKKHY